MPNVKTIIDEHNKRVLRTLEPKIASVERSCNCRKKTNVPLATNAYVGLTDTDFKARFANHNQSFKNVFHSNQTELSKYSVAVGKCLSKLQHYLKILGRARPYSTTTKRCNLGTIREILHNLSSGARQIHQTVRISKWLSDASKFLLKKL